MYLTNFHFYPNKNYLYSKPVKGLQGYGFGYHFSFNGQERDNETYGEGNAFDFGARIYDPRLGRWMSVDPMQEKYVSYSPYNYSINSPIMLGDPDGNWVEVKTTKYKMVNGEKVKISFLKSIFVKADIIERQIIIHRAKFIDLTGEMTESDKAEMASKIQSDITNRWSTCNSKYADNDGYVTNSKGQKIKVITSFSEPIKIENDYKRLKTADQVFTMVHDDDKRLEYEKRGSYGTAKLNGGIMYLNLEKWKGKEINLIVHEAGHWGGLNDIKEITKPINEMGKIDEVMSWYSPINRTVGPTPDEFTNFYKRGTTYGFQKDGDNVRPSKKDKK